MDALLNSFIHWVSTHPQLTGLFVGIVAFTESLAFVGLIVPGSTLVLGAGALIGAGLVDFWSIFAWAVGGAVLGDGVSYWLGHHYRDQLRELRIVRRHPQWLEHATVFFQRHGGKSVLLARFVGPVRPIVPVVAGMTNMPPVRFYLNNILSALVWAPTHLLAGMLVGASLVLAGQVATRLVIVLGAFAIAVWLIIWLVHRSYLTLQSKLGPWISRILTWCYKHPRLSWLFTDLYDPSRPPARALLIWLVLLIASIWLFLGVLEDILTRDPLIYAGQAIYQYLQQLRTPPGDAIMIVITELGDSAVTLPLAFTIVAWLLWRRAWRDALYWLGALGFGVLAIIIVKYISQTSLPLAAAANVDFYSIPSGHATMSTVIYGLLAVFVASSLQPRWRWPVYALATVVIIAISFSRLYLGAHWLADVTAGLALATSGISLLAIAYTRHRRVSITGYGLPLLAGFVFVVSAVVHIHDQYHHDRQRFAIRHHIATLDATRWTEQAWQDLPMWRHDLRGEREQPLNVQWAGKLTTIQQQLRAHGWRKPLLLSPHTALSWFLPGPTLKDLPVLPQLHNGQAESLVMVYPDTDKQEFILRLWPTNQRLQPGNTPVWLGTVTSLRLHHLPLISFLRLNGHYAQALSTLQTTLPKTLWQLRQRNLSNHSNHANWDGRLLLIGRPGLAS
ncbi:MAG: VTT domain-containing protein [Gammaproteobacteria bacterium]